MREAHSRRRRTARSGTLLLDDESKCGRSCLASCDYLSIRVGSLLLADVRSRVPASPRRHQLRPRSSVIQSVAPNACPFHCRIGTLPCCISMPLSTVQCRMHAYKLHACDSYIQLRQTPTITKATRYSSRCGERSRQKVPQHVECANSDVPPPA